MGAVIGNPKIEALIRRAEAVLDEENLDESAIIGTLMLIAEVRSGTGETAFYTFCTDKRTWIQTAMIREADAAVTFSEVENGD